MPAKKTNPKATKSNTQSLLESELLFRSFVQQNIDGIVLIDSEGMVVEWNASMEELSGYGSIDMVGLKMWEMSFVVNREENPTPERRRQVEETYRNILRTGVVPEKIRASETTLITKDGKQIFVEQKVFIIKTNKGNWIGVIARDLTERNRLQREAQEERDFALQIINTLGQGLTVTDKNGNYILVNPAFADLLGYEADELIGKNPSEIASAEDEETLKQALAERLQGKTTTYSGNLIHKDGKSIPVLITGAPRVKTGEYAGSIASITDMTEIKRAETERTLTEEQIQQRLNELATINAVSQVAASQLELNSMIELTGERLRQIPNVECLFIALYDSQSQMISFPYYRFYQDTIPASPIPLGQGLTSRVIESRQPLVINQDTDRESDKLGVIRHHAPGKQHQPAKSWMGIPMQVGDEIIGVLGVQNFERPNAYTENDVRLWETIASNVAVAVQNAQLYSAAQQEIAERKQADAKIQQRLNELATINAISQVAASQLELSAMIELTGERLRQIPNVDCLFIALYDSQTQMINFPYFRFYQDTIPTEPNPLGEGLTSRVIQNRKPLIINQDVEEKRVELGAIRHHAPGKQHLPPKSWMGIPIQVGDRIIGALGIQNFEREQAFSEDDVRLWETIAANVGVAIQNAQLYAAAQQELAERKKLIEELETRNTELTQFTYTVSHELKSPVVTMKGFIGSISSDLKNQKYERLENDLKRVAVAVDKMYETLSDLLELSRIGRMMNEPVDVPFGDIVQDSLELVHGRIESHNITVHTQPNLPTVHGDRQRLTEVLQNLIDNAAKYMGGQPDPVIEIGQQGEEHGKFIFFVKDNGMGIAPEYHERIFGLFNKLDAKSEGTGIGLALVKRIIEVHGGSIWVESEAGHGAAFYFTLPRK